MCESTRKRFREYEMADSVGRNTQYRQSSARRRKWKSVDELVSEAWSL
jgi:hypothetical protein